jgi:hypothetical protein
LSLQNKDIHYLAFFWFNGADIASSLPIEYEVEMQRFSLGFLVGMHILRQ